ncbi:MAG: glycosyltransferase [Bacillota bacterium]|nr:glycosyltransferase [Bacillota bacterium]
MYLSVVVPMYNCEKFIGALADKLIRCTLDNVEFLFVNDGSKDNTLSIMEKYAEKDERIHVIDKENGGVSTARNYGIEAASGKYIWFVDADDSIGEMAIEEIVNVLSEKSYDMLVIDSYMIMEKDKILKSGIEDMEPFEMDSGANEFIMRKIQAGMSNNSIWDKVFKRDIIYKNNLRFMPGVTNGEDGMFFMEYVDKIDSARYVKTPFYFYSRVTNSNSAVRNIRPTVLGSMIEAYKVRKKYILKYCDNDTKQRYNNKLVYACFKNFVNLRWNKNISCDELKHWIEKMVNEEFLIEEYKGVNKKKLSYSMRYFLKIYNKKDVKAIYRLVILTADAYTLKASFKIL